MARLVPLLIQRTLGGALRVEWAGRWRKETIRQQRCLEVASRPRHVLTYLDETRRTYRHHGRQRDAPRRIATFHHATLRVALHRYATREPLGTPGGSRAFSAQTVTLKRLWLRDGHVQRVHSLSPNPRRNASPICPHLIYDRHRPTSGGMIIPSSADRSKVC